MRSKFFSRFVAGAVSMLLPALALQAQGNSLGKLAVLGDSLSAGFQNFSLYTSAAGGQEFGYGAVIAKQAGLDLKTPTISYPGIPPALAIDAARQIYRQSSIGMRVNTDVQTLNLSVPSFTLADTLARVVNISNVTNPIDALTLSVLGYPGLANKSRPCGTLAFPAPILIISALKCATELQPDTIILGVGNNDALQALTFGTNPTNPAVFDASYQLIVTALTLSGSKIVAANIPDVTSTPFLIPVSAFVTKCGMTPAGAGPNDYVVPNLVNPNNGSADICQNFAVRSASLIRSAQSAVAAYNRTIARCVGLVRGVVVDLNSLLAGIVRNGYEANGQTLTAAAGGGIFSLDSIHPTNTGYAIIANAFINVMNSTWGAGIPLVSVNEVAQTDPLVPHTH
jgi:hypothetical protein